MVKLINQSDRTFGEYGEEGYAGTVTDEVYEEHRFQSSRGGQRKARHEMTMVTKFLATLPPDQRVLDAPCGMGRFTDAIVGAGHRSVSLDLNIGMLTRAATRHGSRSLFVEGNVMRLPFEDATFDAAICFRLLHHLGDNMILDVLRELRRVSSVALVTYYDTRCFKYRRKRLLNKRVSGQYYPVDHMHALCSEAGWGDSVHVNPYDIHRNLHGLRLTG